MPIASQTDTLQRFAPASRSVRAEHRRDALRALPAAITAAPPPSAFCWWLTPCGPWLSSAVGRRR
jgi:hypothetical protein